MSVSELGQPARFSLETRGWTVAVAGSILGSDDRSTVLMDAIERACEQATRSGDLCISFELSSDARSTSDDNFSEFVERCMQAVRRLLGGKRQFTRVVRKHGLPRVVFDLTGPTDCGSVSDPTSPTRHTGDTETATSLPHVNLPRDRQTPAEIESANAVRLIEQLTSVQSPVVAEIREWLASLEGRQFEAGTGQRIVDSIRHVVRRAGHRLVFVESGERTAVTVAWSEGQRSKNTSIDLFSTTDGRQRRVKSSVSMPALEIEPDD